MPALYIVSLCYIDVLFFLGPDSVHLIMSHRRSLPDKSSRKHCTIGHRQEFGIMSSYVEIVIYQALIPSSSIGD
jgi:hypothetical protein